MRTSIYQYSTAPQKIPSFDNSTGTINSTNIQTLQNISMQELAECFNLAFSDYLVPLQVDAGQLANGLKVKGVRMDLSAGAFDQGRLVGFVLTGTDTVRGIPTAYNAGTGVSPVYRGHRLTRRLYDFLLPMLQECRIKECLLEVITENASALRVYESLGYVRTRLLKCYKGNLVANARTEDAEIRQLTEIDSGRWQSFWDWQPTWQNGMMAVSRSFTSLIVLGAFIDERLAGYIAYNPLQKRVHQFAVDKDYRRRGIGRQLFGYIAAQKGSGISVLNVDGNAAETDAFLQSLGLTHYTSQFDMKLRLAPYNETGEPVNPNLLTNKLPQ